MASRVATCSTLVRGCTWWVVHSSLGEGLYNQQICALRVGNKLYQATALTLAQHPVTGNHKTYCLLPVQPVWSCRYVS